MRHCIFPNPRFYRNTFNRSILLVFRHVLNLDDVATVVPYGKLFEPIEEEADNEDFDFEEHFYFEHESVDENCHNAGDSGQSREGKDGVEIHNGAKAKGSPDTEKPNSKGEGKIQPTGILADLKHQKVNIAQIQCIISPDRIFNASIPTKQQWQSDNIKAVKDVFLMDVALREIGLINDKEWDEMQRIRMEREEEEERKRREREREIEKIRRDEERIRIRDERIQRNKNKEKQRLQEIEAEFRRKVEKQQKNTTQQNPNQKKKNKNKKQKWY